MVLQCVFFLRAPNSPGSTKSGKSFLSCRNRLCQMCSLLKDLKEYDVGNFGSGTHETGHDVLLAK